MANPLAIDVSHISKRYRLGPAAINRSLIDTIGEWGASTLRRCWGEGKAHAAAPDFWALKDVSFQVPAGEAVGIIGHNGAGKSTLLKILSRITEPTEGRVRYAGKIGSLLEVGTGFHPELSGRDNIFLSGAVLGMRRREIASKFDEIVEFSGVEKFIDTPVKRYSSGMYLRLAFSVAAHLQTDILLVDEVLAVGDLAFQKKCLGRMGDVAQQGRTILFVSHNLTAVRALCRRAILLDSGRVAAEGPVDQVLATYYEEHLGGHGDLGRARLWRPPATPDPSPIRMVRAGLPAGWRCQGLNRHVHPLCHRMGLYQLRRRRKDRAFDHVSR